jgi:hypothetical protein
MKSEFEKELEIKEEFNQMLDECYPDTKISYLTFTASEILFNCDPIAYRVWLSDWEADAESRGE